MKTKKDARLRRAARARARIAERGAHRLTVYRSGQHIYAQVITPEGGTVIAAASTVQKTLREGLKNTHNVEAAKAVGKAVAEKAKAAGVEQVAFDRSGYKFHGCVKALADAARESGLKF